MADANCSFDLVPKNVWMVLSGAAAMQSEQRGLYQSLLQQSRRPDLVETIQIDVPRTFPDNVYFHGGGQQQQSLFNVLVAYAHFNQVSAIARCRGGAQGLNFIAGLLLLATEDEEATFWLLRALLERLLPDYYGRHMTGLLTDIEGADATSARTSGQARGVLAIMTTKWFVCLFAEVLPIEAAEGAPKRTSSSSPSAIGGRCFKDGQSPAAPNTSGQLTDPSTASTAEILTARSVLNMRRSNL
ncbi:hypothetical protein HPB49_009274 [Dermacentor silvarum]|uniref:Uncharacterized protein n=1 Tax=Dermacentor silvarum TaxID=543639 RepID=A0ACB8DC87_DERSI|nr:hypothetical protein HPB49_009274 [Dermacentor silvarum]